MPVKFNPVNLLERVGINNFQVEYQFRTVRLDPVDLKKAADHLGKSVWPEVMFYHEDWLFTGSLLKQAI